MILPEFLKPENFTEKELKYILESLKGGNLEFDEKTLAYYIEVFENELEKRDIV
jgi:hypothetical protein